MATSVQRPLRVAILLTVVVVAIVLLLASAVGASPSSQPGSWITHTVVSGDTLWDIAGAYTGAGDDVRRTIFDIKRANDLDDSIIHPGQQLLVPVG